MIKLSLTSGGTSQELVFGDLVTLGRSGENTLVIDHKKVSRNHAKIEKVDGRYRVTDLDSGNGTKLNGSDVASEPISVGDEIRIGEAILCVVEMDGVAAAPLPAPPPFDSAQGKPGPAPVPRLAAKTDIPTPQSLPKSEAPKAAAKSDETQVVEPRRRGRRRRVGGSPSSMAGIAAAAAGVFVVIIIICGAASSGSPAPVARGMESPRVAGEEISAPAPARDAAQPGRKPSAPAVVSSADRAVRERRWGDAIEALKLKGDEAALGSVIDDMNRDFAAIDEAGRRLEAEKKFSEAAAHYGDQAPRFRGTDHFRFLSHKAENMGILARGGTIVSEPARPAPPPAPVASMPRPERSPSRPGSREPEPRTAPAPEPKKEMARKPDPQPPPAKPAMMEAPKPAPAMEAPKPPPPREMGKGACDCKRVVKGVWCPECKRALEPDDLRKGLCKKCDGKPKKVDFCVKRFYQVDGRPDMVSDRPIDFEGKRYDIPSEDRAVVSHQCRSCGAEGEGAGDVKHADDCKNRLAVQKVCSKSGQPPHVSEAK